MVFFRRYLHLTNRLFDGPSQLQPIIPIYQDWKAVQISSNDSTCKTIQTPKEEKKNCVQNGRKAASQ
jgi:hypothetical protein